MELTLERARELRDIHSSHPPDECIVHLEAAFPAADGNWIMISSIQPRRRHGETRNEPVHLGFHSP
ncbi:hypothetical protein [Nocardia jiangxiensis]|uniref:Uncharacterized protein n=1 Tax=Nocardia jiangxiensis TaxID=282685 RepID=A0ABW6S696_9NOCA|nr:hypothetical protein [Nocardia jiangxiensis]